MTSFSKIQGDLHRRFSSSAKSILIHLHNYRFESGDSNKDELYIHREHLENQLESWLLNASKFGSYLVSGYRGMGKSRLVDEVLSRITKGMTNAAYERVWNIAVLILFISFYLYLLKSEIIYLVGGGCLFCLLVTIIIFHNRLNILKLEIGIKLFPLRGCISREKIKKIFAFHDKSRQNYRRIGIKINLGKEVLNARDVLCLIANHVKDSYKEFLYTRHHKPLIKSVMTLITLLSAYIASQYIFIPTLKILYYDIIRTCHPTFFGLVADIIVKHHWIYPLLLLFVFCGAIWLVRRVIQTSTASFDKSHVCLNRLNYLSNWITSDLSEESSKEVKVPHSQVWVGFGKRKKQATNKANVRDIEAELIDIINTINSPSCLKHNRVQFYIVLDELDKIEQRDTTKNDTSSPELVPPEFSTTIGGFSNTTSKVDRQNMVLNILGSMKLFLTTAKAKFIFISGREMFDAYLADTSDREYAISSIFSGVINVSSFLYPDHEQSDISSLTEQYVVKALLPSDYLWNKIEQNAIVNGVLKREIPSLRWYTQYLTELVEKEYLSEEQERYRKMEIRHVVMFLRHFIGYLSHVSKGAPKKIVLHLENYIKRREDCVKLYDWDDTIECGESKEARFASDNGAKSDSSSEYVLLFTPNEQQKIGFISLLTAPIMNTVINSVSNYNDKLLIEASFLIDHLFKFHGRGFSWRNIEQTPELLDANKTSDLNDFITSIIEFMQQLHMTPIMVGLFKFKFRKRISEEITYISRTSDEAAAMFNFSLNESKPVRTYNFKLLDYYMHLSNKITDGKSRGKYNDVIARIHATLGDIYFLEENYVRALQEYRSSINYLEPIEQSDKSKPENRLSVITRLRNMLKMGLTCEYSKNYETAYVIYCNIVDAMISVREVDERLLGLDLVDTWVDDWRVKQPVVVDPRVHTQTIFAIGSEKQQKLSEYNHCVKDLMWDDGREIGIYKDSEYSLDFENLISGFSKNLSPKKSHFVAQLSMFEDIRLVYKAILAKLFITEKMNMSGITQSNIESAEAEFKYLHRTTSLKEKFFISADFFNELGKILYYKNSSRLIDYGTSTQDGCLESLRESLYWCDFDLYAYLDEFCFYIYNNKKLDLKCRDAKIVKSVIYDYLHTLSLDMYKGDSTHNINPNRSLHDMIKYYGESLQSGTIKEIAERYDVSDKDKDVTEILRQYFLYVESRLKLIDKQFDNSHIRDCRIKRASAKAEQKRLPCHACKYVKRSMNILISNMFINERKASQSREIFLILNSFADKLKITRVHHVRLLAANIASMGNIMFSCTNDTYISRPAITLIKTVLNLGKRTNDRDKFNNEVSALTSGSHSFDSVLLYYISAYRYYSIARLDKDACDCLLKLLIAVNNALTVTESLSAKPSRHAYNIEYYNTLSNMLEAVFSRYAKLINRQYGYSGHSDVFDYRWIFSMPREEDLNLSRSIIYSELVEPLWHIIDSKLKLLSIIARHDTSLTKQATSMQIQLIHEAYALFGYLGKPHNTFYNEVINYFARFNLNNMVLQGLFNGGVLIMQPSSDDIKPMYAGNCEEVFISRLREYLSSDRSQYSDYEKIFDINVTQEDCIEQRRTLVEFLIEDSIVCLTEILYVLSPYNHISSFSNNFIAGIYNHLWEYAKMYESLGMLYDYIRYEQSDLYNDLFKYWGLGSSNRNNDFDNKLINQLKDTMSACRDLISPSCDLTGKYGSMRNKLYTRLRHQIDDRTLNCMVSNYAAEMALRYYSLVDSSYSEGISYRNQVSRNYLLNDDLDNDTWLFNTAIERYRINTEYTKEHKHRLSQAITKSRFYSYNSYARQTDRETTLTPIFDDVRFDDSLFINTEL